MAGRFQWTSALVSAPGGVAITTTKTIVGGYGGVGNSKTLGDFRLTDSLGGTAKVKYNQGLVDSPGWSATIGGTRWINLAHPIMFDKGLSCSIGDNKSIISQVLYKRVV